MGKDVSDERLIFKVHKEFIQPEQQQQKNLIKKPTEDVNRHFSKEDLEMANSHVKRCWTSRIIRERQIKITMRYHLTHVIMVIIKKTTQHNCW